MSRPIEPYNVSIYMRKNMCVQNSKEKHVLKFHISWLEDKHVGESNKRDFKKRKRAYGIRKKEIIWESYYHLKEHNAYHFQQIY